MIYNIISGIVFTIFITIIVIFSISNNHLINISFWPFAFKLQMPLYLAIILISFIFFLIGALLIYIPGIGTKLKLKNANKRIKDLEKEIDDIEHKNKLSIKSEKKKDDIKKDAKTIELKVDK